MSEILDTAVAALTEKLGGSDIGGTVKFAIDGEGGVIVDGDGARVSDDPADVTLAADAETFQGIMSGDVNPTSAFMTGKLKVDGDMGQRQRMAHRHQLRGTLGGHDTGDAGDAEHVTLLVTTLLDQRQGLGLHDDTTTGQRTSRARLLVTDIDHVGLAGLVEMGQFTHCLTRFLGQSITLTGCIARGCRVERS